MAVISPRLDGGLTTAVWGGRAVVDPWHRGIGIANGLDQLPIVKSMPLIANVPSSLCHTGGEHETSCCDTNTRPSCAARGTGRTDCRSTP